MQLSGDKISDKLTRLPPFGQIPQVTSQLIGVFFFPKMTQKLE